MFQNFDATFGGSGFAFHRCAWISPGHMVARGKTIANADADDVRRVVETIRGDDERPLACLDFEIADDRDSIVRYLEMFRAAAPEMRVGFYPSPLKAKAPRDINHEMLIDRAPTTVRYLTAARNYMRSVYRLVDYLAPDCYLLGDASFDRDLKSIVEKVRWLRSYDKPIYPFVWGIWHPGPDYDGDGIPDWNPPRCAGDHEKPWKSPADGEQWYTRPNDEQRAALLATLREACDGCIVWGEVEQNRELLELLK